MSWRDCTVLHWHCILHWLPPELSRPRDSSLLQRVMNFSEAQNQDNILVRQAYLHKIGQLMRTRQHLTAQLTGALPSGSRWGQDLGHVTAGCLCRCQLPGSACLAYSRGGLNMSGRLRQGLWHLLLLSIA